MRMNLFARLDNAQALLFDLDGVLVDSAAMHMRAYEVAFSEAGLIFPEPARTMVRGGASRSRVLAQALRGSDHPQFQQLYERKGAVFRDLLQKHTLAPIAGAPEFVRKMKQQGKRLALVTSSREPQLSLAPLGLTDIFEVIVDASDGAIPKPHPASYQIAMQRLGIDSRLCIAFEDSTEGAAAASAAGILVVGVGQGAREEVKHWVTDFTDAKLSPQ